MASPYQLLIRGRWPRKRKRMLRRFISTDRKSYLFKEIIETEKRDIYMRTPEEARLVIDAVKRQWFALDNPQAIFRLQNLTYTSWGRSIYRPTFVDDEEEILYRIGFS
jgi:hypothetical protein